MKRQILGGGEQAMSSGDRQGSTRVIQEAEGASGNLAKSLYCGFQEKKWGEANSKQA